MAIRETAYGPLDSRIAQTVRLRARERGDSIESQTIAETIQVSRRGPTVRQTATKAKGRIPIQSRGRELKGGGSGIGTIWPSHFSPLSRRSERAR